MTTSTETLIIELDARTAKLQTELERTNRQLDETENNTRKADTALKSFATGAKATAVAVTAAAAALTTMVVLAGKTTREMENMARLAGTNKENFEALAFTFSQFGVDAKGTADSLNDVRERLGEFAAAGSGPFQDFADVMGLGAEEAKTLAEEMQYLSGEEAIGRMVSEMEAAEVPAAQMSFVMKSMSNDLEYASAAFAENGKELNRLKGRYDVMNKQLGITAAQAEDLKFASESFNLMTESFGKASTAISATLAPVMTEFFNDIIEVVPNATNTIIDFINSFKSAESIKSVSQLDAQIEATTGRIAEMQKQLSSKGLTDMSGGIGFSAASLVSESSEDLDAELVKLRELVDQRATILDEQAVADAERREGFKKKKKEEEGSGGISSDLQALLDSFKTEEELRIEKYERDYELLAGHLELQKELEQRFADETTQIAIDAEQKKVDAKKKAEKEEDKILRDKNRTEKKALNDSLDAVATTSNLIFEDNKAVSAGIAVVNTAVGITDALRTQNYASAAAIAAAGVAQLAAINSASRGGGGSSSAGGAGSAPQQNFTEETQDVQVSGTVVTEQGVTESSQTLVNMADPEDVAVIMGKWLQNAQENGRLA